MPKRVRKTAGGRMPAAMLGKNHETDCQARANLRLQSSLNGSGLTEAVLPVLPRRTGLKRREELVPVGWSNGTPLDRRA
jgi:hypothetical protein